MPKHPYREFENTRAWNLLNSAISELEENQDLELLTPKEYVVGYISKLLSEESLVTVTALHKTIS